jgi:hypothetical protein
VIETGQFYVAQNQPAGSHLALPWRGRVSYVLPRAAVPQKAGWRLFQPGRLVYPLRAMARLPRIFGAIDCVESESLAQIREVIGNKVGLTCCRLGAPGPWTKETILFLDQAAEPELIVKAGKGEAVDRLLLNEAAWLSILREQPSLAGHIPEMVAHRSGADLSFVAQTILPGESDFELGEPHFDFLKKLQAYSRQTIRLAESRLHQNLCARLNVLQGHLTEAWSTRLATGMRRMEQLLSGAPILFVAAHNDFTPWNVRVERGFLRVFDWEYADYEQLPLFDPLHFTLMPLALKRSSSARMLQKLQRTLNKCESWLGPDERHAAAAQTLAYLLNLCTLYLWSQCGKSHSDPVLESYARLMDELLLLEEFPSA